jgi:hypothetical protein
MVICSETWVPHIVRGSTCSTTEFRSAVSDETLFFTSFAKADVRVPCSCRVISDKVWAISLFVKVKNLMWDCHNAISDDR